nr:mannosyltransferase family protein [Kineococcus siccus]
MAEVARFQEPSIWTPQDPGYHDVLALWDATWYEEIAETGYPASVPLGQDGDPRQSALAFYPLFPLLCRLVMSATGVSFATAGASVSLVCGAAAAVLVHALVRHAVAATGARAVVAGRAAWSAAVLFCCSPVSPVFQVAYTEALAVALLAAVLLLLLRERYLPAALLALLLGLSRPVAVPLTVVVVVHLVLRARAGRAAGVRPGPAAVLRALGLLAASGVAGLLWPVTAWWLTGRADAYTATMGAWRTGGRVVWLEPWWGVSQYVLGAVAGPVLLVAAVAGFTAWVLSRRTALLGPQVRAWCLAYVGYLLLVLDPFTSLFRYLVLLFPLGGLVALRPRSRGTLRALVVASLALQVVWVAWLWRFSPPADWPP